jgi:acetolactate synthase I/II/III large subunit
LILAGHGITIAHAEQELAEFAERGNIPVATTLHGIGCIPRSHRCYAGMLGMHGNLAPNTCTNLADAIIALGMRFDDRVTGKIDGYAQKAAIIHVDIDPAELGKNVKPDYAIAGDVKEILRRMIPALETRNRDSWFAVFEEYHRLEHEQVIQRETHPGSGGMRMGEFFSALSNETNGEALIVADVGQNQMSAARYYHFNTLNSFITSGGLGTMGFALPAGMGAKIGNPDREIWVTVGDGGFQMTIQEMATIAQENLDIKIAILNNGCLGMVRQWQCLFFKKRYSQVFLKNPDFIKLSDGFGIPAERVAQRNDILPAIRRARQHRGAFLIEFIIETEANLFPIMPPGASVDEMRME